MKLRRPSREDINCFLLAFVIALIITYLSFSAAKFAYEHHWWMFR